MKKQAQKKRREEAANDPTYVKQEPKTLENTREKDDTTVDVADDEVIFDINHDDYEDYFKKTYEPKILITSSDNPHSVYYYIYFIRFFFNVTYIVIFRKQIGLSENSQR